MFYIWLCDIRELAAGAHEQPLLRLFLRSLLVKLLEAPR
jgi:hypothetical protein